VALPRQRPAVTEGTAHGRLVGLARALMAAPDDAGAAQRLVEHAIFAAPDELVAALDVAIGEDLLGLPPWARNLLFRLACLQAPGDADLRRRAASDLRLFGPDWDAEADRLDREADAVDRHGPE
jgi:hypothetical protein